MTDRADTSVHQLMAAAAIGRQSGLRYVYAGNRPGRVGDLEDTRCGGCGATLVERRGYVVGRESCDVGRRLSDVCKAAVPGIWSSRLRLRERFGGPP